MTYMTKSSTSFNKHVLGYSAFITERNIKLTRFPVTFPSTVIVNWGNSCKLKPQKKTFLLRINEQIYISFRKSSKRTNLGWLFQFFTAGSQRRWLELLSYGGYSQLFISVICFLKTTHSSVLFFIINRFFSFRKEVHLHNFSAVENYWSQQQRFKN